MVDNQNNIIALSPHGGNFTKIYEITDFAFNKDSKSFHDDFNQQERIHIKNLYQALGITSFTYGSNLCIYTKNK